jgi:Rps23 Pro-64 3,4-dihydroxylase Tpa1-like proline 4-hydroxylase
MIDPALDIRRWRAELARHSRVQIGPFLEPEAAEALRRCLVEEVPWSLAVRDADGARAIRAEQLVAIGPDATRALVEGAARHARDGYAFAYESYMMVTAYKEGRDPHLVLHRVLEFFNSPDYLAFARALTGEPAIRRIDAQATRYRPGHFLNRHDDSDAAGEGRLYAYVLNLTKDWRADDGGLLHFIGADGGVTATLLPRFNTLSLFRVPQAHFVSMVAPWARSDRLAITGWMMR